MIKTKLDLDVEKEVKNDPSLREELARADRAIEISMQIYTLRKDRGLTQGQLAKLIGISQPNVARLENSDYGNYSLQTLEKIAKALSVKLKVILQEREEISETYSFVSFVSTPIVRGAGGLVYFFKSVGNLYFNDLHAQVDDAYEKVSISNKAEKNSEHKFSFNFL